MLNHSQTQAVLADPPGRLLVTNASIGETLHDGTVRSFSVIEFHGSGDPFFGGSADDRPLLQNGRFAEHGYNRTDVARFAHRADAVAMATIANRRDGGLVSVSWSREAPNA